MGISPHSLVALVSKHKNTTKVIIMIAAGLRGSTNTRSRWERLIERLEDRIADIHTVYQQTRQTKETYTEAYHNNKALKRFRDCFQRLFILRIL